ncbi:hypothetical protein ACFWXO_43700 [Kitasatospora sp. NPDC059088]|uniref:hypothetical protein n=1 Tax=Kitasatospora sp. NPDC059088 TaxID=3346722 RepID=UPI0036BEE125
MPAHEIRISSADRSDIRIGPVDDRRQAVAIAVNLQAARNTSPHHRGVVITVGDWKPGGQGLPLLPPDPHTIATWLMREHADGPDGRYFPDLHTRLRAQYPGRQAAELWEQAAALVSGADPHLLPVPATAHSREEVDTGTGNAWIATRLQAVAVAATLTALILATPGWLGDLVLAATTGLVAGHALSGQLAEGPRDNAVVLGLYLGLLLALVDLAATNLH